MYNAHNTQKIMLLLILWTSFNCFSKNLEIILISAGSTSYDIIINGNETSKTERYAAEELSQFLKQRTTAVFPVRTDKQITAGKHIFIGDSSELRRLIPDLHLDSLENEGYVIKTVGNNLILAGKQGRGSLYAVYGFLEDYLGCRWFTPEVSKIPRIRDLTIPSLDNKFNPLLEYREVYYYEAFNSTWAARNRLNGNFHKLSAKQGGKINYHNGFVHTCKRYVSVKDYYKTHPEYFSLKNGKRIKKNGQLCLSNQDVLDIVIKKMRKNLRKVKASKSKDLIISFSQNDNPNYCECPNCLAIATKEGSQSGPIIHFVNQMADAIKDEFPNLAIDTLAYTYSRKPPKHVRPRQNVIVRLCDAECCFSHPLESKDCSYNVAFAKDLKAWSAICDRIYVWDYVVNFSHFLMPYPNLRVLKTNLQFFINNGVRGVFEQGNRSGWGEFSQLKSYLLAKLLWNPSSDIEKHTDEFLEAYYGAAAPFIKNYIDLLHDSVAKEKSHIRMYDPPHSYLKQSLLTTAKTYFKHAENAVRNNPTLLLRVRHAYMPLIYVQLMKEHRGSDKYNQLLSQFSKLLKELKISNTSESEKTVKWLEHMKVNDREVFLSDKWAFRKENGNQNVNKLFSQFDFDDSNWIKIPVPGIWDSIFSVGNHLGYAWYRVRFRLPKKYHKQNFILRFNGVDEQCWVYINGQYIGERTDASTGKKPKDYWHESFSFPIKKETFKLNGENVLAIRVHNALGQGGIYKSIVLLTEDKSVKPNL
jgi:Domain of unknown function (DUF4838)/Glycosyl hydrolases family 2, sugar binding domain/Glycosyl hydrolase family 67 N-terminus